MPGWLAHDAVWGNLLPLYNPLTVAVLERNVIIGHYWFGSLVIW